MNEAFEPPKIVPLAPRLDGAGERVGELLNAVRGIAGKRLQQCLGNLFEHVDDALFDLAEKAENNATQTHYFDGGALVNGRWVWMQRGPIADPTADEAKSLGRELRRARGDIVFEPKP